MSKHLNVGRSWRTWAKHELMKSFLGQEVGVVNRAPALRDMSRLIWLDLTAGDAAPNMDAVWSDACSPGILARCATGSRKPVEIVLHEIQTSTFDLLIKNLIIQLPDLGYVRTGEHQWQFDDRVTLHALNESGHEASVDMIRKQDAVFVLNDPNAITEWAMRDTFAREIGDRTWCFRSLSTMGCNPAGLKRLEKEERLHWFNFPATQEKALPNYRDLILAAIDRDEAQWAYLLSTSSLWRDKTEAVFKTAFKKCGRSTAMAWLRHDPARFEETKRKLFLTKTERAELESQQLPFWEAS